MKTQIKRFSKSTLAVVLTICMLVSCMTVGIIATDAAKVQSEVVGSTNIPVGTYYLDFTDVGISATQQYASGGVNYWQNKSGSTGGQYDSSGQGKMITSTFTWKWDNADYFIKTEKGGWSSIDFTTPTSGYTVASVWDDGAGYSWMKNITFSEETTLYFKLDKWWNNTTTYHRLQLTKSDGTKTTVPLYNLTSYTANNSTLSSSSTGADDTVFFANVPAGTYFKGRLLRQKSSSATTISSTNTNNVSGFFQITTDTKNQFGDISAENTSGASWSWVDHTSAATLTSNASDTKVNDTVTLTPGITNTKLNSLDSGSYTVKIDGNNATLNTDYTLSGNSLVPKTVGSYEVTYTATYHAKGFTSKTATASKSITFDVATDQVTHDVTFTNEPANGTVTVNGKSSSPQAVVENENFTVLATPETGYTIDTFTVGGTDYKSSLTGNDTDGYTYSGSVGTADKTVVATFAKQSYALNYTNAANQHTFDVKVDGSSISSGTNVEYGKTVNVTVNGYDDSNGTIYIINSVTGQTLTSVSGSGTKTYSGTFTMPASAVTLTATSVPTYRVNFTGDSNMTVTVRKTNSTGAVVSNGDYVAANTKLYVAATAASGYELNNSIGVILAQGTATGTTIPYSGTIDAVNAPVTINVTSKKITQYTVTLNTTTNVTGYTIAYTKNKKAVSATAYSAPVTVDAGSNVTITATPKGRATVTKWTVNGTDEASTSTTKTITAIAANTTASATAAKSDDVIYIKPHSGALAGDIYYYTWNKSTDTQTSGAWPGTKIWNGSSVPSSVSSTVYYDSNAGVFVVSGLTAGDGIKFRGGSDTYQTSDQTVEFGKTYVLTSDDNWTSTVKSLGDLTDETIIYVNKEVTAQTYTKYINGVHVWWGDCQPLGTAQDNLRTSDMPTGVTKSSVELDGQDYWKVTIPNYLFTSETARLFNITFYVYDWNPTETSQTYNLDIGKAYKFDITYNTANTWDVEEEEVDDEGGDSPVVATSDYYLDGWTHVNNSAFSKVDNSLRMMVGTLDEGSYSYYKVNTLAYSGHGDTGLSLFAVKTPADATTPVSNDKYLYALCSDNYASNNVYISYRIGSDWTADQFMSYVGDNGSNKVWRYPIPANIDEFYIRAVKDGDNYYSANISPSNGDTLSYQIYGNKQYNSWNSGYSDVQTKGAASGSTATGTYYVWNKDNVYVTTTPNEDLFQSDGLLQNSGYDDGKSAFDLPFHTGTTASGYYVIVIHPNTNYRFTKEDGTVLTYNNTSSHPIIYTSSVLPGVEMPPTPVRAIYAKDGALRNGYQRFSEFGTTVITQILDTNGTDVTSSFASSHARKDWTDGADGNMDYDYVENIPFGYTIKWTTTLGTDKYDGTNEFKNSHYVRGFSVNGVTEELFEYSNTGVYTGTHVVNNEDCRRGHIEITPVYWLKNATYTKTFYVTGFDRTNTAYRELGWGDELGIYPYYENVNGAANAFGGYPGQPMIFYKGTYVQQIPTTVTGLAGGAQIKGMTLSNNYWDLLHRSVNGSDPIYPINHHRQTYDFDDFYEIANEQKPDSITFSYRLRTVNDNFGDTAEKRNILTDDSSIHAATVTLSDYENTTTHNGTEIYKDALDRQIDLFGTVLTSAQASQDPLLVITNGYKNTYVGKYATEWAVYRKDGSTYRYITSISPSALEVKSSANLSKYGAGAYTAAYTALEAYRGVPVKISFEKSMENSTGDIADRLDGRWYYTKSGDQVEANIVIQYDDGNGYVSDDFTATTGDDRNLGSHTKARAYFTNVTPNDIYGDVTSGKTTLTADTQYFNLKAEESANYQFVGWYQMQDNQYVPMEQEEGVTETHTIIKSNETYYARFKKITSGTLSVKHIIQNGTIDGTNYNGTGTPYLSVQITDTDGTVVANFPKATGSSFIHSKYIRSLYANYNIKVTIQTDPDEENVFRTYALTDHSNDKFITPTSGSLTNSGDCVFEFKVADLFDNTLSNQTVTSLEYVSRLTKTEYTYDYQIDYVFPSRYWNEQTYRVTGSIAANRVSNFVEGKQTSAKLKQSVLQTLTPYESQFRKVISWGYTAGYNSQTATLVSGTNYKISTTITANFNENELVHAEFKLPYEYDKTTEHYTAITRDFYSTTPAYANKTEEEYRAIYQNDVSGDPSVTVYGTTHIEPTATQTTTTVDGESSGVGYSTNYSSFTLASEVGRTFNTDNSVTTDRSAMKMVTAPDYVYKVNGTDNVAYHTYRVAAYYYSYNAGEQGYHYGYKDFNDGIIANNLQKKYFTRWDIYVDGKVINSCYSKEFNYTAYQDIVVVPVYESDSPSANVTGAAGQGAVANITFLGTTRNQWNVEGLGNSQVQVKKGGVFVNVTATDRLFADFDVDLAYNNKVFRDIDGTVSGNMQFETGVVIQQLGDLSGRGTDSVDTNATTYANLYKDQYDAAAMAAWINTGSGSKGDSFTTVKSVIGDNFGNDDSKRLDKNHELISNKNTVEYCYYLTKSRRLSGESEDTNYPNNYSRAYRAIAYVKYSTDGGATWTTAVSSTPAYFTIYDEAIREQ